MRSRALRVTRFAVSATSSVASRADASRRPEPCRRRLRLRAQPLDLRALDLQLAVPVAERQVIERPGCEVPRDRVVDRLVLANEARQELPDAAVRDADAHVIRRPKVGREVVGRVPERVLIEQRARQQSHPFARDDRLARAEDVDIAGALSAPALRSVQRGRGEEVVIAREQEHRDRDLSHLVERAPDGVRLEPVVLEDIPGHDHEVRFVLALARSPRRQRAERITSITRFTWMPSLR